MARINPDQIERETRYPGVVRLRNGKYWLRKRVKSPSTGKLREISKVVTARNDSDASLILARLVDEIRGGSQPTQLPRLAAYAKLLLERKVAVGEFSGKNTLRGFENAMKKLLPVLGDYFIDKIRRSDLENYRAWLARQYAPRTVNTNLAWVRLLVNSYVAEYELPTNPAKSLKAVDVSASRTYTRANPNSLGLEETRILLEVIRDTEPYYYVIFVLGFSLGQRPSNLTPIRKVDVDFKTGEITICRSHTEGSEVLERTKQKKDLTVRMKAPLCALLKAHIEGVQGRAADSELLFPNAKGRMIPRTTLSAALDRCMLRLAQRDLTPDQAQQLARWSMTLQSRGRRIRRGLFRQALARAATQGWPIGTFPVLSLRAMRRSFYRYTDELGIDDYSARLVSGHASEAMANRYRTDGKVGGVQEEVVGRIIGRIGPKTAVL